MFQDTGEDLQNYNIENRISEYGNERIEHVERLKKSFPK
jgi:hypothetical protein